jgi:sugar phosphate isomerase/epimerase
MITLSAFADEISTDLSEQLNLLASEQITHIDFRGTNGKKVGDLSAKELQETKWTFAQEGITVSCIGSAIGKILITADLKAHFDDVKRAVEIAHTMDTRYIRMFSFHCPEGQDMDGYRGAVIDEIQRYIEYASQAGVVLLHENEKHIFGDTVDRCLQLFEACYGPSFRGIFDPANFIYYGIRPYDEAYPRLSRYISYFHIKDALRIDGKFTNVYAGVGEGQLRELLRHLKEARFVGTLALEPHVKPRSPETFRTAIRALKLLLEEAGLQWK